jgi:hypothetical protein
MIMCISWSQDKKTLVDVLSEMSVFEFHFFKYQSNCISVAFGQQE